MQPLGFLRQSEKFDEQEFHLEFLDSNSLLFVGVVFSFISFIGGAMHFLSNDERIKVQNI